MPAKFILGLKCRECGRRYDLKPVHICEYDFGPLEVDYDYEAIAKAVSREIIESRPKNMWRYAEFLPLAGDPIVGRNTGFTPLVRAERLGKELGLKNLWIKNDAVNYPTLSFKDRVVSVALSKAKEFGFDTVACATTGNLGNSVAAQSIRAGLECFIFMPANLEQGKIIGTSVYGVHVVGIGGNYDGVNRLCSEIGNKFGWAFANINMRPYYSEGSKTYGMELCEQLGWKAPDHVIVPMAGGSLICKIKKAVDELHKCGLIDSNHTKIYGAQAAGCAPISTAVKKGWELFKPVKPDTIARSIAIGNPADGFYAIKNITGSGGWSEDVTDEELVEGIKLLARTEGIFTETAGGVTVAVTKKLVEQGRLPAGDTVVISVTGNGLKTIEAVMPAVPKPDVIEAKLSDFEALVEKIKDRSKAAAPAAAGGLNVTTEDTESTEMEVNEITKIIIGAAMEVHRNLGPGLLESTYEACLMHELVTHGLVVEKQKALPVDYKGVRLDCGYRIDLLVENEVIVELKVVDALTSVHEAQLLSYLKLSRKKVGLLINFNVQVLKQGIKRMMN